MNSDVKKLVKRFDRLEKKTIKQIKKRILEHYLSQGWVVCKFFPNRKDVVMKKWFDYYGYIHYRIEDYSKVTTKSIYIRSIGKVGWSIPPILDGRVGWLINDMTAGIYYINRSHYTLKDWLGYSKDFY